LLYWETFLEEQIQHTKEALKMKYKIKQKQNQRITRITEATLVVGADNAKKIHVAWAVDFRGIELGKDCVFLNNSEGLTKLATCEQVNAEYTANTTNENARQLQNTLYLAAKENPKRKFHALYDKVFRKLWEAWMRVKTNRGSAVSMGKPSTSSFVRSEKKPSSKRSSSSYRMGNTDRLLLSGRSRSRTAKDVLWVRSIPVVKN
jgi:hypothetical protein